MNKILAIILAFIAYVLIVLLIDMFFGASYFGGHCIDWTIFKPAHWLINKTLGVCG